MHGAIQIYAFRDISPVAPTHILIIPKNKDGLTGISQVVDCLARLWRDTPTFWGICW
jgi:diadenosine tetraphosphate (Ap4A) HIT family hydrolase